jgi:hypothetical protein
VRLHLESTTFKEYFNTIYVLKTVDILETVNSQHRQ